MRIIARRALREFWLQNPRAQKPLEAWFGEVSKAGWDGPQAIKRSYRHASFVVDNRVIFNIGGNKYRLVVHVNYEYGIVYIKFIGSHKDYDLIDPETV
jgi:mRNA interferase HigB